MAVWLQSSQTNASFSFLQDADLIPVLSLPCSGAAALPLVSLLWKCWVAAEVAHEQKMNHSAFIKSDKRKYPSIN